MAKLLLDENLSRRLLRFLAFDFPESAHTSLFGLRDADDREIWRFARENGFAIVMRDADFADISAVEGYPPYVIWLRLGNCGNARIIQELTSRRDAIERTLAEGEIAILEIR